MYLTINVKSVMKLLSDKYLNKNKWNLNSSTSIWPEKNQHNIDILYLSSMITSEKYHQYNIQCTCNIKLVSRWTKGPMWPWLYGSSIYTYQCNHIQTLIRSGASLARCT